MVTGPGPQGEGDHRAPLPCSRSLFTQTLSHDLGAPSLLQYSPESSIHLQIGDPHLQSWGVLAQTLGYPVLESSIQHLGVPLFSPNLGCPSLILGSQCSPPNSETHPQLGFLPTVGSSPRSLDNLTLKSASP